MRDTAHSCCQRREPCNCVHVLLVVICQCGATLLASCLCILKVSYITDSNRPVNCFSGQRGGNIVFNLLYKTIILYTYYAKFFSPALVQISQTLFNISQKNNKIDQKNMELEISWLLRTQFCWIVGCKMIGGALSFLYSATIKKTTLIWSFAQRREAKKNHK